MGFYHNLLNKIKDDVSNNNLVKAKENLYSLISLLKDDYKKAKSKDEKLMVEKAARRLLSVYKELESGKLSDSSYIILGLNKVSTNNEPIINKDEPIDLEEIIKVNDLISPMLDKADLIQNEYVLDVTTFGAEKKIDVAKLDKYVGKYVNIHLDRPYKGLNIIEGDLISVDNDKVVITYKDKTRTIKCELVRKDIDKARLAIKF